MASNFANMILMKMYFGRMVENLYVNRINNGICIGVNVYNDDWESLYRYLT